MKPHAGAGPRVLAALSLVTAVATSAAPAARAADPFLRRTAAVEAVQRVGPSVVNITTERTVASRPFRSPFEGDPLFERFFRDFFEPRVARKTQSLGSGVIIDEDGHVLTNEHVVARASRIRAALADGREYDAELVGADPNNDLAVLRLQTDEKPPWTPLGSSEDLMVGEPVIAIGNPFGLSNTVTTGVISALDRSIRSQDRVFYGFLQTDASINPGNSGGPLLNAAGELVGINTAIYGGGAQGIGFAIPIDTAKRVIAQLIERGEVAPVWLGFELQRLDADLHEALALPPGLRGALVAGVVGATPAARAGVQRGDLVVRVDGHPVRSPREFYEMLERATAGQEMELELWRRGATRSVRVRCLEIPPQEIRRLGERLLGMRLTAEPGGGFRIAEVRPGSGAQRIGIQAGDLLLGIDGRALRDGAALQGSFLELRGRSRALLVVQRGSARYHVQVPLS